MATNGASTPSEFFEEEHRSLDHILADVEYLADRRSFKSAAVRFGEFRRCIEAHLRDEDQVLLAFFLEHTGDPNHVVPLIRREHAEVHRALDEVSTALSHEDHTLFCERLEKLGDAIRSHQANEEQVLHPALDALLPAKGAWERLRARATKLPVKRVPSHS